MSLVLQHRAFLYIAQSRTSFELDLIQKVSEVRYLVTSLGVFLRCARCGLIGRLACPRIFSGYGGGGALLFVPLGLINLWFSLFICRLTRNMAVDSMLTFVGTGWLTEIDWKNLED